MWILWMTSSLSSHSTSASVSELSRLVTHTAVSSPKCNSEKRPRVTFRTLFKWHRYCGILKIHIVRKINTGIRYEPVYRPALLHNVEMLQWWFENLCDIFFFFYSSWINSPTFSRQAQSCKCQLPIIVLLFPALRCFNSLDWWTMWWEQQERQQEGSRWHWHHSEPINMFTHWEVALGSCAPS